MLVARATAQRDILGLKGAQHQATQQDGLGADSRSPPAQVDFRSPSRENNVQTENVRWALLPVINRSERGLEGPFSNPSNREVYNRVSFCRLTRKSTGKSARPTETYATVA